MTALNYLTVEEVAEKLRTSRRVIHEMTRTRTIPHRKLPSQRRCLFIEAEVDRWISEQPELEIKELHRGGRIVRPKGTA